MRRGLLDVNVLLALLDGDHVDHERAHTWLDHEVEGGWASCPITENGFVRTISRPRYPSPISPAAAIRLLRQACASAHHEFWQGDISVLDGRIVGEAHVHGPVQVTDAYLLALAVSREGRFVTFDRSVALSAVAGAREDHLAVL